MNRLLILSLFIALWTSCKEEKDPTYRPYVSLYNDEQSVEVRSLLAKWDSVERPTLPCTRRIDSAWLFVKGDSLEGLTTEVKENINTPISLPHRINAANHPLWYRSSVSLNAPGIFYISGDDGVQLFINGKQVKRISENFFSADFSGTADVVVRVLNNAMQGGLRYVCYLTVEEYKAFEAAKLKYIRLKHLVESASLINELRKQQLDALRDAINDPGDSLIEASERQFEAYPFITGPWIVNNGKFVRIMAMTDNTREIQLYYGTDSTRMDKKLTSKGPLVNFEIPYDSARIFYQLFCRKTISPLYRFNTTESDKFTFNAWADSQYGWKDFSRNLANISMYDDAFGLGAGDLVSNGSDPEQWREFYNILSYSASQRPYYLIAGNHDYDGYYDDLIPKLYRTMNTVDQPHYYSWTYANCIFMALDPNENFPIGIAEGTEQYKWFMSQVESESWKNAKWRFVFLHQPPYSQGWEGYSGDHFLRKLFEPVAEKTSIDFVITGHTHDYERLSKTYGSNETLYLILGGGGGTLEPAESSMNPKMDTVIKKHHIGHFSVSRDTVRFDAIDVNGDVMDSFIKVKH